MAKNLKHIETDLAVINIYTKLFDVNGNQVESVEIRPNQYAGEPKVEIELPDGKRSNYLRVRLIKNYDQNK